MPLYVRAILEAPEGPIQYLTGFNVASTCVGKYIQIRLTTYICIDQFVFEHQNYLM